MFNLGASIYASGYHCNPKNFRGCKALGFILCLALISPSLCVSVIQYKTDGTGYLQSGRRRTKSEYQNQRNKRSESKTCY